MKALNKVILIDDDPIHLFLSKRLIDKLKITKHLKTFGTSASGKEYIEDACLHEKDKKCPDLVFLDKRMPGMDGEEVLDDLKNKGVDMENHLKVAMVSSSFTGSECDSLKEKGAIECIVKPLEEKSINGLIEKHF